MLLMCADCSGHGEAERGDAPVPFQGALQSADSGESVGRPGRGGGEEMRPGPACSRSSAWLVS